mgnify:CR=1 FL=1
MDRVRSGAFSREIPREEIEDRERRHGSVDLVFLLCLPNDTGPYKHRLMRLRNIRFLLLFSVIACGGSGSSSPTAPVVTPKPVVTLNQPQSHTNVLAVTISGSTSANATLQISGGAAVVTATASASGTFNASVILKANQENQISVVATNSAGGRSAAAVVTVVHDDIAPDAPTPSVGRYAGADPFPFTGTTEAGAEVTLTSAIDSVQATADTNGRFEQEIHLVPEAVNEITLVAQDLAGNQGSQYVAEIISDTLPPIVGFHQVNDDDEDGRANISFIASDECALCGHYPLTEPRTNGVDLTSLFLANDRAIGGGSALGGIDAGENILESVDLAPVTEISVDTGELSVAYEVGLAYEFPSGANVLTITVADSAGNTSTDDIEFTSEYGAPSLTLHDLTASDRGFLILSEMYDSGGMLNCWVGAPVGCEGLNVVADQKLIALLTSDGTKGDDVAAGENFGHLFTYGEIVADTSGFWNDYQNFVHHQGEGVFSPGISGAYTFFNTARDLGGDTVTVEITGYVTDRAGNFSLGHSLPTLVPATPSSIFILNSSATPGDQAHVVPVGLTNFQPLRGAEFFLEFDLDVMTVDSVKSTGRVPFSPFYESTHDSVSGVGTLSVLLVDLAGNLIPAASDTMAHIYTSIKANAPSTEMILEMRFAEAAGEDGNPIEVTAKSGTLLIP